jgi:hypothetical protein
MDIGFIILRHVNSKITDEYWQICWDSIRKYYPLNKILIIDDNSTQEFISEKSLSDTVIIDSEFPRRGELLPYYYYLHNKFCEKVVILHDSVFVNAEIDFNTTNYTMLFEFEHNADQPKDEIRLINLLSNKEELLAFHKQKGLWKGCFGGMSIISHDFLTLLDNKYNIAKLLAGITTRYHRMSFERVIACILQKNSPKKTLLGNILKYCNWGYTFDKYLLHKNELKLPLIKVWTGR